MASASFASSEDTRWAESVDNAVWTVQPYLRRAYKTFGEAYKDIKSLLVSANFRWPAVSSVSGDAIKDRFVRDLTSVLYNAKHFVMDQPPKGIARTMTAPSPPAVPAPARRSRPDAVTPPSSFPHYDWARSPQRAQSSFSYRNRANSPQPWHDRYTPSSRSRSRSPNRQVPARNFAAQRPSSGYSMEGVIDADLLAVAPSTKTAFPAFITASQLQRSQAAVAVQRPSSGYSMSGITDADLIAANTSARLTARQGAPGAERASRPPHPQPVVAVQLPSSEYSMSGITDADLIASNPSTQSTAAQGYKLTVPTSPSQAVSPADRPLSEYSSGAATDAALPAAFPSTQPSVA
ncbi:hypothetical protein E8E13_000591 [Curvularia kusanoi]|uniref:Uncharacterized protein n=1 Tax=Curvularia kusanoi TaxID=90978 RepID=A0A9P4W5J9_CURKU|nr:hypothetical protein E8E13_000591 [Curvularia kusanoi]